MPPGPALSFFGDNRSCVPAIAPWEAFKNLNRCYGPVVSFFLGSTPVVVLGTAQAAWDLLEKRGDIYSSRPRNIMANEILSGGMRGIGMPYGPRWRKWRTLQQSALNIQASATYRVLQTIESSILLRELLKTNNPESHRSHMMRYAISITFCVAYGRRVEELNDPLVIANQRIEQRELWAGNTPLQWFRYKADRDRAFDTRVYMDALNDVKARLKQGIAQPSMATHAIEKQEEFGLNDLETAYALSAPWSAGVATTISAIEVAILAMLHFPSVMRDAQKELDNVIGNSRLPSFADYDSLPYMQALLKETLRWRPIAPTGVAHSVTEDNVYNGMFIPRGSTVYANIYEIVSDPQLFPDPDKFMPERFLNSSDARLANYTVSFGFGRRICPGLHIAQQSMFIIIARMLWAFDVLPLKDGDGNVTIPSSNDFTKAGLVRRPVNLKYRLAPRQEGVREIINSEAERAEAEAAAWDT
ncbi:hypothetical protein VNI00_007812 [Paramarasmius palmivorus]|uniref:Cytochrome P450 n=1 Tax=Paramarasmius palmivorus TaxID=297713 RepID=A0AAW0CZ41_9AGAR